MVDASDSVRGAPTFDGRIKPDVVAMGLGVTSINPQTRSRFTHTHRGTSASTPLGTGVVALLMQAFPLATPRDIASAIRSTASQSQAPDNGIGYGIIQGRTAFEALLAQFGENRYARTQQCRRFFPLVAGNGRRLKTRRLVTKLSQPVQCGNLDSVQTFTTESGDAPRLRFAGQFGA